MLRELVVKSIAIETELLAIAQASQDPNTQADISGIVSDLQALGAPILFPAALQGMISSQGAKVADLLQKKIDLDNKVLALLPAPKTA